MMQGENWEMRRVRLGREGVVLERAGPGESHHEEAMPAFRSMALGSNGMSEATRLFVLASGSRCTVGNAGEPSRRPDPAGGIHRLQELRSA